MFKVGDSVDFRPLGYFEVTHIVGEGDIDWYWGRFYPADCWERRQYPYDAIIESTRKDDDDGYKKHRITLFCD